MRGQWNDIMIVEDESCRFNPKSANADANDRSTAYTSLDAHLDGLALVVSLRRHPTGEIRPFNLIKRVSN